LCVIDQRPSISCRAERECALQRQPPLRQVHQQPARQDDADHERLGAGQIAEPRAQAGQRGRGERAVLERTPGEERGQREAGQVEAVALDAGRALAQPRMQGEDHAGHERHPGPELLPGELPDGERRHAAGQHVDELAGGLEVESEQTAHRRHRERRQRVEVVGEGAAPVAREEGDGHRHEARAIVEDEGIDQRLDGAREQGDADDGDGAGPRRHSRLATRCHEPCSRLRRAPVSTREDPGRLGTA
jgi:hypothetical protein